MHKVLMSYVRGSIATLALAASLLATSASTGAAEEVGPWTKVCENQNRPNEVCVTRQVRTDADGERGLMLVRMSKQRKLLVLGLRAGLSLREGWVWDLEPADSNSKKYVVCDLVYCVTQVDVEDDLLTKIRGTKTLTVTGTSLDGEPFTVSFDTRAFAETMDGPGTALEDMQSPQNEEN